MTRKLRSDMVDVPHLTRARRVVGRPTATMSLLTAAVPQ
jgi:hypothetical protein